MKLIRSAVFAIMLMLPALAHATSFFTTNNQGQILQPNGQVWQGRGIAVGASELDTLLTNSQAQPLTTLFPDINYVRLDINLSNYNCGAYDFTLNLPTSTVGNGQTLKNALSYYVTELTKLNIVVIIDQHAFPQANSNYTATCSVQSGTQLTAEETWYQTWVQAFSNNAYVWYQTPNEPFWSANNGNAPVTTEQLGIYNTIRQTNNSIVVLELIGGGDGGYLGSPCQVSNSCLSPTSSYSNMTSVVWDLHVYSGCSGDSTSNPPVTCDVYPESHFTSAITSAISQINTISTSVGSNTPVLIGEFGPNNIGDVYTNNGTGYDVNGLATIDAVFDSGLSGAAWITGFCAMSTNCAATTTNTDSLLNSNTQLTTNYGSYVSTWTSTNPCCSLSQTQVPAPLTGNVTTQTWATYDETFTTPSYPYNITLASGKPFHFQVLPPAQYNPNQYKYPLLIWLHPSSEGDSWYQGNASSTQLSNSGYEGALFNTTSFLTAYPAVIVLPYADQTTDNPQNFGAVENWGGWANNGTVGSGTNYSGDTGPNTFALLDMVQFLEENYCIDPNRIYVEGFSLGGIGSEYLMLLYNSVNGSPGIFAAGASMAGVLEINGFNSSGAGNGPTQANANTMQNVPVWWFSGGQDSDSKPGDWNNPIATDLGATSYPSAITSVSTNKIGNSQMEYTLCPTCGHTDYDVNGNPVWTNSTIMNWMFSINGPGSGCTTNCTPATATTWNLSDTAGGIALSNNNLTATSSTTNGQGVRSTTSQSSKKWCAQIELVTATYNMSVGIDNKSDALTGYLGGSGSLGIGLYHQYDGGQEIYVNGSPVSQGTAGPSSAGEIVTIELDATNNLVWFTDTKMRAAGYTWNNSTTANPETGTGGLATSAFGGPYYLVANTQDTGSVFLLNPSPTNTCTASFQDWQSATPILTQHHPIIFTLF